MHQRSYGSGLSRGFTIQRTVQQFSVRSVRIVVSSNPETAVSADQRLILEENCTLLLTVTLVQCM